MKPVVSAAQIAAQAYAQRTAVPPRATPQAGFSVDGKTAPERPVPAKAPNAVRRLAQESDAFKIEISAEALEASARDGGRRSSGAAGIVEETQAEIAEIAFRPIDPVDQVSLTKRREAPFAHTASQAGADEPVRRPGSLLDITI